MKITDTIQRAINQLDALQRQTMEIERAIIKHRKQLETVKMSLDSLTSPFNALELNSGLLRSIKGYLSDGMDLYEAIRTVAKDCGISADTIYSVWISNRQAEKEYKKYGKKYAVNLLKKAGLNNRQIASIIGCSEAYIYSLKKDFKE